MRGLLDRLRRSAAIRRREAALDRLDAHLMRDIGLLERGEPPVAALWRPRLEARLRRR